MNANNLIDEFEIKRHNFDVAKNRLKEFSERNDAKIEIDNVRTDGRFFGLGDHKVTGVELNERLKAIQEHFVTVNENNNEAIKEFREVYNVFEALDSEYIKSILINFEAVKKTSNDVRKQQDILKRHNEKLGNQQTKLDTHQFEIEKSVENISKIVSALKIFKEKLEGFKHLTDIDKIWNDCRVIQNEIQSVSDNIAALSKKTTEDIDSANQKNITLSNQVNRDILTLRNEAESFRTFFSDLSRKIEQTTDVLNNELPVIQETAAFVEQLNNITHLYDIDFMWNDLNDAKVNFELIEKSLQKINANILMIQTHTAEINSFIIVLQSYVHLKDIDEMWNDLDAAKDGLIKTNIEVNNVWKTTEEHKVYLARLEQTDKIYAEQLDELSQMDHSILKKIDFNNQEIDNLKKYKEELDKISHLKDVDRLWESVEKHSSELLESMKRDKDLITTIQKNKNDVDGKIIDVVNTSDATVESLTKKIKYAYWIAGGSIGFSILQMILNLMKVI